MTIDTIENHGVTMEGLGLVHDMEKIRESLSSAAIAVTDVVMARELDIRDAVTIGYFDARSGRYSDDYLRTLAELDVAYTNPTEDEADNGDVNARRYLGAVAAGEYLLFTESEESQVEFIPLSFRLYSRREKLALATTVYTKGDTDYFDSLGTVNPD